MAMADGQTDEGLREFVGCWARETEARLTAESQDFGEVTWWTVVRRGQTSGPESVPLDPAQSRSQIIVFLDAVVKLR